MSEKRDWFQIVVNTVIVGGISFGAYQAFMHPREASKIMLAVAATMAIIGVLGLVITLIRRLIGGINKSFAVGEFDLADRMRFWLLGRLWLANWFPNMWDHLKEDIRRKHQCELSDCWNDPEHMFDGHRVCSKHYAELLAIEAAREGH